MIEFVQVLECCVERTDNRAHERMEASRKEKRGLLGVAKDGSLWVYDYELHGWRFFPGGRTL